LGFSLEKIIDNSESYSAPDNAFIKTVSVMVQSFPWERFERYFESKPLIEASALDQVFLLRVLAIQELLCLDDESVLRWLKSQMYLFAFLSPGFKPKVPTKSLLNNFRDKLQDANLLEPFRVRCHNIIVRQNGSHSAPHQVETTGYIEAFAPSPLNLSESGMLKDTKVSASEALAEIQLEDKWVICPECESSALQNVAPSAKSSAPQACCKQCGHRFKV